MNDAEHIRNFVMRKITSRRKIVWTNCIKGQDGFLD
jgi:hypothetical protein